MVLTNEQKKIWTSILQAFAPSGSEEQIRKLMHSYYSRYTNLIIQDNLGSTFAVLPNTSNLKNAKRVLVLSHGDEVGFMVRNINEKGLISVQPLGGIFSQTLLSNRVTLLTNNNQFLSGAISAISPHLLSAESRNKPVQIEDMLFDFGFTSRTEVLANGIEQGNFLICDGPTQFLNNDKRLLSKAIDNRMGVILGLELLNRVFNHKRDFDLYIGFSTQEEVGTRGAQTAVNLINPDFCIVTDVSPGQDYSSTTTFGQLGSGVMVRGMDREYITRKDLLNYQREIIRKNNIPNQFYISPGGTDAKATHLFNVGVPTIQACLIARNLHTPSGIIDTDDFNATLNMVEAIINDLDNKKIISFNWANGG